jgi:hypothetical protein
MGGNKYLTGEGSEPKAVPVKPELTIKCFYLPIIVKA